MRWNSMRIRKTECEMTTLVLIASDVSKNGLLWANSDSSNFTGNGGRIDTSTFADCSEWPTALRHKKESVHCRCSSKIVPTESSNESRNGSKIWKSPARFATAPPRFLNRTRNSGILAETPHQRPCMFSSFRNRARSDAELINRLAHVVDPRRFAFFASVRSSSRAVRQLRAESFPHITQDLERFRLSVSGHGQFSKLAELTVKINPNEDRVAVARMKNGGEVIL